MPGGLESWFDGALIALSFVWPAVLVVLVIRPVARRVNNTTSSILRVVKWLGLGAAGLLGYGFCFMGGAMCCVHPMFSARVAARQTGCETHLKELSSAVVLYTQDWDDREPPANHWGDSIAKYLPSTLSLRPEWQSDDVRSVFQCPAARRPFAYAFNQYLDHAPLARIDSPANQTLLFESDATSRNASGDQRSLAARHMDFANVAFADGHVRLANDYVRKQMVWELPKKPSGSSGGPPERPHETP